MTTPKRPSLADTIARIDAQLAEHEPPLVIEGPMPSSDITKLNVLVVEPGTLAAVFGPPPAVDEPLPQSTVPNPPATEPGWGWLGRALNRLIP